MYLYLTTRGKRGGEREPLSDKDTKIYTCCTFPQSKGNLEPPWGRTGWGQRAWKLLAVKKKHPGSWVFCFLRRDRVICTAERNDRDWLCVRRLHTGTALWVGCVFLFAFMGNRARGKTPQWSKMSNATMHRHESDTTQAVRTALTVDNCHNSWDLAQQLTSRPSMASCCAGLIIWGLYSVAADRSGKQIMALFQEHTGSTKG